MRSISVVLLLFLILTMSIGCTGSPGQDVGGFSNKKQVLKLDSNADIFEWDGAVYKTGVDWIEEEQLTKGEQIGKISKDIANKLPVGAKIFASKERGDILIVEYDGKEIRYLLQLGE